MSVLWLTGADGFAGTWLRRLLEAKEQPYLSLVLPENVHQIEGPTVGLDLSMLKGFPSKEECLDFERLPEPGGLIHLAALSFPPACEENPELAHAINVSGPCRLYEQILARWPECPILHVSSGHVYQPQGDPLNEEQLLEPVNVYGATKLEGEGVAQGFRDRGHRVSVVRPFNHSGAGQAPTFVLPSFATRLVQLEKSGGGTLKVGRLDSVRDFLHVQDVAKSYLSLLELAGTFDLCNLCSGEGISIQAFLDGFLERCSTQIQVQTDSKRLRGSQDANCLVGDNRKLGQLLGEAPRLQFDLLLDELMEDAHHRVAEGEDLHLA
ncbi:MAG: GDP-mannose 4,6-dehydratase [Planctomycetota bacterium]|jgi:GDP-4-dehydro-6-deoxy-D-mannose reductase|nr:GDP-mannose 4,6-dehydratase [Planctomycetota bacterium]MDP6941711.1 GDP-mannose 4,6-dehydratase [Planctomycetota bacterium]